MSMIEIRRAANEAECDVLGHELDVVYGGTGHPPRTVVCARCESFWRIHPDDTDKRWGAFT